VRLLEQRGPQVLVIALIIALGVDSALILTRALSHGNPAAGSFSPTAVAPARPAVNPAVQLAGIVNAHLFGRPGVASGDNAPNTTMPLILAGVIADRDPTKGQAIIGDNAASAKLFAVGAMIPGGARLHAIYSDRVIIERNGGLETLKLPRTALSASARSVPQPAARTEAARDSSSVLAGLVRIQPVFNQGKLSGYRIFPGGSRGNSAFTQLGLRAGDLILAVNGTPLDDAGRAMEVLQTLSASASATITVSRNGQSQEVNLNLANLNVDSESNPSDNGASSGQGTTTGTAPSAEAPINPSVGPRGRLGGFAPPASPPAAIGNTPSAPAAATDAPPASDAGAPTGEQAR
jgi:general secretion pathway protein C